MFPINSIADLGPCAKQHVRGVERDRQDLPGGNSVRRLRSTWSWLGALLAMPAEIATVRVESLETSSVSSSIPFSCKSPQSRAFLGSVLATQTAGSQRFPDR